MQFKNEYTFFINAYFIFIQESNIDFSEIEEALILVKEKRANKNKNEEFLNIVDAEKIKGNKNFNK